MLVLVSLVVMLTALIGCSILLDILANRNEQRVLEQEAAMLPVTYTNKRGAGNERNKRK